MSGSQEIIKRNAKGQWAPGQSGLPGGRGAVSRIVRQRIAEELEPLLSKLLTLAKEGDVEALKIALSRVCPPLKSDREPGEIAGLIEARTLGEKAEAILHAIGKGELDADRGARVLASLASVGALKELEELKARLAAVESKDLL